MNPHRRLASLAALPLAAALLVGCSQGSPTEPSLEQSALSVAPASSLTSVSDESRGRGRGGDDDRDDDRRGRRGRDDRNGNDDRGGRNGGDDRGGRNGGGGGGGDDRGGRNGGGGGGGRNDDGQPRTGLEFEGAVVAVNGQTITIAGGTRIVVNGATQWSGRGDLFTLDAVAGSLASGDPTRVEGRGERQANGTLLARTIKAEVDN